MSFEEEWVYDYLKSRIKEEPYHSLLAKSDMVHSVSGDEMLVSQQGLSVQPG